MSRSNPFKKKRRQVSRTLLILGEGMSDEIFLKHLRKLYSHQVGVRITIRKGRGGDPASVVIDASRSIEDFHETMVVLDDDWSANEMDQAKTEAKKRKIKIIKNTPCLECLLLSILGQPVSNKESRDYKQEFEKNYIKRSKRDNPYEYEKLFPKKLLEEKRKSIKELDTLIRIMEGQ